MSGMGMAGIGAIAVAFVGTAIATTVAVSKSAKNDNKAELAVTIYNTTIVNSVFVFILGIVAYYYIGGDTALADSYIMIMLHVALFVSLMGASVSVLHQLN
jgi:hypothetical protein